MQLDGLHSFRLVLCCDRSICNSDDITNIDFICEFRVQFGFRFLTYPQLAGPDHGHWSSVNVIYNLEHWHGPSNHCTCTDELSCPTISTLSSSKSWHLANWYTNYFSERYIVKSSKVSIHSSGDAEAITISSSESDFYMVISLGRYLQE